MLLVKIYNNKENRENIFNKTIGNITNFIFNTLSFNKAKIASDSDCIEITSGNNIIETEDNLIVAELLVKKTITIKKSDLSDNQKLDKFISEIKGFCSQAKLIENFEYLPIEIRNNQDIKTR